MEKKGTESVVKRTNAREVTLTADAIVVCKRVKRRKGGRANAGRGGREGEEDEDDDDNEPDDGGGERRGGEREMRGEGSDEALRMLGLLS